MITNVYIGVVAQAAGTVDAITATYLPAPTVLADKMLLWFRATGANATTTPTFSPNGLTAKTIVKQGGQALAAGDIPGVGAVMEVCYDETAGKWELINPATGNKLYKVYKALLTQTGTNAPVATMLENTLGGTVVWTYDSTGSFNATLTNAFTTNKTFIETSIVDHGLVSGAEFFLIAGWVNQNTINVGLLNGDASTRTNDLGRGYLEIHVYY